MNSTSSIHKNAKCLCSSASIGRCSHIIGGSTIAIDFIVAIIGRSNIVDRSMRSGICLINGIVSFVGWDRHESSSTASSWRKLPRKVLYKGTFGAPDQGHTLDVWESQTTESALGWQRRHIAPRHILELSLEVILEHVLGIKTMTWIINPGSCSDSLSLPRN